jgi:hypothetical protein
MKKHILLICAGLVYFGTLAQEYNHRNLKIMEAAPVSDQQEATPSNFETRYMSDQLRLYPILASETFIQETRDLGKFTLLQEAIGNGKIVISETGANGLNDPINSRQEVSGTVNTLVARNTSRDTIFIMAGEVVKGGKQDRVIAQDLVLLPNQEVNLSAFCVEASRWNTRENNGGQFDGYFSVSSMDIRKSVVTERDQQKVWAKVDVHTAANKATSGTKTYTNLENSEEYQTQLKAYLEKLDNVFDDNPRVVGVIAVTGDRVMGMDVFATHELFTAAYSNLLHSYVNEAITHGAAVTISNEEVYQYLDKLLSADENQNALIRANGNVYEFKNKKVHLSYY